MSVKKLTLYTHRLLQNFWPDAVVLCLPEGEIS